MRYPDDPDWWHERVFAWPITNTLFLVVRTADGDQYDENLGDMKGWRRWAKVADTQTALCRSSRFLVESLEMRCKNV